MKRSEIVTIKSFEKETGIHFTLNHTGKMEGMQSLSTSCLMNPACLARMKDPDSICSKCFAAAMHKRYSALGLRLAHNTQALSEKLYTMKNNLMSGRIDTTSEVQLVSDDGKVRITYHHNDLGMKYRVQVDTGARRMRWQTVGYGSTYLQVLNTFNRIVSDRARAFKFC